MELLQGGGGAEVQEVPGAVVEGAHAAAAMRPGSTVLSRLSGEAEPHAARSDFRSSSTPVLLPRNAKVSGTAGDGDASSEASTTPSSAT